MKKIYILSMLSAGIIYAQDAKIKIENASFPIQEFKNRHELVQNGQNEKTSVAVVQDTLWYTLNKHGYRNQSWGGFYTVKAPYPSATLQLNHFGAKFMNSSPILISGLEIAAQRQASSPSASVPVRIYLCNLDANGNAQMPGIDSVQVVLTGTTIQFPGANFNIPKLVNGNFAIVYRNISTVAGDTIRAWMNNAGTTSFTVPARQYGEGIGLMSIKIGTAAPVHTVTTNMFGVNWDNEFLVAPRVSFSITANASHQPTANCLQTVLFSGNPSHHLTNKFFNMFAFTTAWGPFTGTLGSPVPAGQFLYNWSVGGASPTATTQNATTNYTNNGVMPVSFTCKYLKQNDSGIMVSDTYTGSITVSGCTTTAISDINSLEQSITLFPNPAGSHLNIKSEIENVKYSVLNMLGETVLSGKVQMGLNDINISQLKPGVYFVRFNASNKERVIKVVKE
ncbi:MAG: T9SS type A sorting domain-containing protein [Bacteroidia bacterium]|nr:T9SS type A sorting domain-containing protein [Bacteroidia bacterium]